MDARTDADTLETEEWIDSLRAVLHYRGSDRAAFLIEQITDEAQRAGVSAPFTLNTPYVNSIPPEREERANWIAPLSIASARSFAGTQLRSSCARTSNPPSLVAISRASSRPPRSTTSASGISGTRRPTSMAATSSMFRATLRPASTRGPSSRAG